jgi:hypothetical protein
MHTCFQSRDIKHIIPHMMCEMARVLRPGGVAVLLSFHADLIVKGCCNSTTSTSSSITATTTTTKVTSSVPSIISSPNNGTTTTSSPAPVPPLRSSHVGISYIPRTRQWGASLPHWPLVTAAGSQSSKASSSSSSFSSSSSSSKVSSKPPNNIPLSFQFIGTYNSEEEAFSALWKAYRQGNFTSSPIINTDSSSDSYGRPDESGGGVSGGGGGGGVSGGEDYPTVHIPGAAWNYRKQKWVTLSVEGTDAVKTASNMALSESETTTTTTTTKTDSLTTATTKEEGTCPSCGKENVVINVRTLVCRSCARKEKKMIKKREEIESNDSLHLAAPKRKQCDPHNLKLISCRKVNIGGLIPSVIVLQKGI